MTGLVLRRYREAGIKASATLKKMAAASEGGRYTSEFKMAA
jgi:hypothetical protein